MVYDWTDRDECLSEIVDAYALAHIWEDYLGADVAYAYTEMGLAGWPQPEWSLFTCIQDIHNLLAFWIVHNTLYNPPNPVVYFLKEHGAAEVTWKAICEAWVKDDFEGKEWTIACIDRMRTLMWDEPFYIKWAAKPTEIRE